MNSVFGISGAHEKELCDWINDSARMGYLMTEEEIIDAIFYLKNPRSSDRYLIWNYLQNCWVKGFINESMSVLEDYQQLREKQLYRAPQPNWKIFFHHYLRHAAVDAQILLDSNRVFYIDFHEFAVGSNGSVYLSHVAPKKYISTMIAFDSVGHIVSCQTRDSELPLKERNSTSIFRSAQDIQVFLKKVVQKIRSVNQLRPVLLLMNGDDCMNSIEGYLMAKRDGIRMIRIYYDSSAYSLEADKGLPKILREVFMRLTYEGVMKKRTFNSMLEDLCKNAYKDLICRKLGQSSVFPVDGDPANVPPTPAKRGRLEPQSSPTTFKQICDLLGEDLVKKFENPNYITELKNEALLYETYQILKEENFEKDLSKKRKLSEN